MQLLLIQVLIVDALKTAKQAAVGMVASNLLSLKKSDHLRRVRGDGRSETLKLAYAVTKTARQSIDKLAHGLLSVTHLTRRSQFILSKSHKTRTNLYDPQHLSLFRKLHLRWELSASGLYCDKSAEQGTYTQDARTVENLSLKPASRHRA